MRTRVWLVAVVLLGMAGCSGQRDGAGSDSPVDAPVSLPQSAEDAKQDAPSALKDPTDARLPKPLIDPDDLLAGGPPPDGIPPIDRPKFERARTVRWLADTEAVLSLTVGAETRGYPLQVMTWHEIVNDTVGGMPVAVTYCPLCNSGVAFDRRVGGRVLSFGTSGKLYADNLVMYDRQTESLWPQLTGKASIGLLTGRTLTAIPMGVVGWQDFRAAAPDAWVLSRQTGFDRPYGRNPYAGYDDPAGDVLFDLPSKADPRLPVKERVVGVAAGGDSVAVLRSRLARSAVRDIVVGGRRLVVWHRPGQASALDEQRVAGGKEIGTVAVFRPYAAGRELHFVAEGNGFRDRETGSHWTVLGRATKGPLAGRRLAPYPHLDTFWFAWVTFHPDTALE